MSVARVANWPATRAVAVGSTMPGQGLDVPECLLGCRHRRVHVDQAEVGGVLLAEGQRLVDHPAELVDGHLADGLGSEPRTGQEELGDRGLGGQGGHVGGQRAADPQVAFDGMQATEGLAGRDVGVELVEGGGVDGVSRLEGPHGVVVALGGQIVRPGRRRVPPGDIGLEGGDRADQSRPTCPGAGR